MSRIVRRARLNVFLEPAHAKQLLELATQKGVSQSSIIATALSSYLSPDGGRDAIYLRRLDRLSSQFERIERDQTILSEAMALFIRYELSIAASIPEHQQEATRAQGKARFEKFIEQLARHLQRGGSLAKEIHESLYPQATHDETRRHGTPPNHEGVS